MTCNCPVCGGWGHMMDGMVAIGSDGVGIFADCRPATPCCFCDGTGTVVAMSVKDAAAREAQLGAQAKRIAELEALASPVWEQSGPSRRGDGCNDS